MHRVTEERTHRECGWKHGEGHGVVALDRKEPPRRLDKMCLLMEVGLSGRRANIRCAIMSVERANPHRVAYRVGKEDAMSQQTVASQDGTPIAYWRSGDGPPLVLVHGSFDDHNVWAPVLAAFEERFSVYAVDRRGRGGSGDGTGHSLESEAADIVEVVEWIGGQEEEVNLLGHSN
jgi:hypothetical protein